MTAPQAAIPPAMKALESVPPLLAIAKAFHPGFPDRTLARVGSPYPVVVDIVPPLHAEEPVSFTFMRSGRSAADMLGCLLGRGIRGNEALGMVDARYL